MDFAITLDHNSKLPLYRQLYEAFRHLILGGRLLPGQHVPSTRSLACSLGISRATVVLSYEQLLSEGYLQTLPGSGTFVCHQLPENFSQPTPTSHELQTDQFEESPIQLSAFGASLLNHQRFPFPESKLPINFGQGQPALDAFPLKTWRQLLSRHCRSGDLIMLGYSHDPLGHRPLREAIAQYLVQYRAVQCKADQILIVNGSQQALDLVARVLIKGGDHVALEDPGYLGARSVFLAHQAKLYPIPVDQSGMRIEDLATQCSDKIKLVYVTPSHQFPTGAVLSLPRRLELLTWARQARALIIEDDYDSEFRYGGQPIPALQGLGQSGSVIYVGTFSKVLFPALRVGYLVVPQALVEVFARAKWLSDHQSPLLEQYTLTDFINEGYLERHIRRMRVLYAQRRQTLVQSLKRHFKEKVTILGEQAGLYLMVRFLTYLDNEEIISRAAQMGVGLINARSYYLKDTPSSEFILGYANLSEWEIQEGVCRLAQGLSS
jgi:GntR family transcriptional regulator/MocR family aminotransferase